MDKSSFVSINRLVDVVGEISGIKLERTYNLGAPKGGSGRNGDNAHIQKVFGWEFPTRLRDGMEKTYQWIKAQLLAAKG